MLLTELAIKHAKSLEKAYRLPDEKGLYLDVRPTGNKYWRVRYKFAGKENTLTIGEYPLIGLREARDKRDDARKMIADKIDPAIIRATEKIDEQTPTFALISEEWLKKREKENLTPRTLEPMYYRLRSLVFPYIGHMLPDQINAQVLLSVMRRIENKGTIETAHRTLGICGQVFRYAIATGRATRDPSHDLKGALQAVNKKHHASITKPSEIGGLMRAIDDYPCSTLTRLVLKFSALTFVRPSEVRKAEWAEFDIQACEWRIPPTRMKMRKPHIVPLSRQTLDIIKELQTMTGHGRYVFPSNRTPSGHRCMSENTVNAALRRMGYEKEEMTAHGFRSMASTSLYENGWMGDAIERQLAHIEKNSVKASYNYAEYLDVRREMMQWWADYLDQLRLDTKKGGQPSRIS